jgi:hypothetical protein
MEEEPVVGAVYEDEDGRSFEVISFDENLGTIEIEYADGTLDEIDLDAWYGMDLTRVYEEEGLEGPDEQEEYGDYDEDEEEDIDTRYDEDEGEDEAHDG